jgi:Phosphotransferase enzyme family
VSVGSFLADPAFPQLGIATDPALMKQTFRTHLRPVGGKVYDIEDCRFIRLRYRQDSRRFLLYTLRLVEPDTGRERDVQVTGLLYAEKNKAEQAWRKLQATDPHQEIPDSWLTFEPVSFVPELGMLVQVFPYDRRLPSLPLLAAGPPPELEPVLVGRFGPGDWRVEAWNVEPVRYRDQGAVLRYTAKGRNAAAGGTREKSFYAKVYRHEKGEQTYQALRVLWSRPSAREGFSVVRPLAYLSDHRALILEEAPGSTLDEILLGDGDSTAAVRRVAQALAAFNQGDAPPTTRPYLLADQVAVLERARRLLGWACPHLRLEVESIIEGVLAGLEEVPLGPTHRDLKPDHIFLDGERTIFIDLDSFAKADPVLDPAYLLARLRAMPALFPIPRERARAAAWEFAEEYFAQVPGAWHDRLPFHYAGTLLEVAHGFFRRQAPDWPGRIAGLVEEARDSLAGKVW